MRLDELDYDLPPDRIAAHPASPRDSARLLVVDRGSGRLAHHHVRDLHDLLAPTDRLVVNDSRVFPARVEGRKAASGGAVSVLFCDFAESPIVTAMLGGKRLRTGTRLQLPESRTATIIAPFDNGLFRLTLDPSNDPIAWLERVGHIPLPPYIARPDAPSDRTGYQTVYARENGSVAAPTAGLHFTPALIERIASRGPQISCVTLHVGPGTFLPIRAPSLDGHHMLLERFSIPADVATAIDTTRTLGGRIVAVGTTTVRALESAAAATGRVQPCSGAETTLFIRPGFAFRTVDALLTNFHLPRSTLLALVYAFGGRDLVRRAYDAAILDGYRFYSYGDAMLIL
ncbi:MAG: tRNA preQ1(34) S-adenosylmethionine ribosyltransferase-isomerase QueA [Deltaproteobacteria bacterium]|nr:tRNA preQ1(34) S-adenosylmethionine ribosyltransferase-isomerase QueA [Deltaproteobacteria bacterium]